MKYKVGDKVRVKDSLISNESYDGIIFVDSMEKYGGETHTITKINESYYGIDEDGDWNWSDGMLDPADKKERYIVFFGEDRRFYLGSLDGKGILMKYNGIDELDDIAGFTQKKALKLMQGIKGIGKVEFVKLEKESDEEKTLYVVSDTSKTLGFQFLNHEVVNNTYCFLGSGENALYKTHLTKKQALEGINRLKDVIDLNCLEIKEV